MIRQLAFSTLLLLGTTAFAQKSGPIATPQTQQAQGGAYRKVTQQLPATAGAAEVRMALLNLYPMVGATGTDLALMHEITSPGGLHYTFAQTWAGVPIHDATVKATLTATKRFMNVMLGLVTFGGQPAGFQRTEASVMAALPAMLDEGFADFNIVSVEREYLLRDGFLLPCHRAVYTSNNMSWELLLADSDLSELQRRDLAAYRKPAGVTSVDTVGNAYVFNPDPLTTSGQPYGCPYCDNGDADNAQLTAARFLVTLRDITHDGTNFILTGPYVEITDRESPVVPPVTSTDGNFFYTRSQQGFEDVMVYYHLDTFQRYVQSLGFMNLQNGPLKADPHGVNGQDNSHFVPAGSDTRLAFGEGGVDDAEDADVIIHEYGHALSNAGSPGTNSGVERQGLDEGIGDYFAASYSRSISYTFWKNTFTWDGHNEFWPGRSASNNTLYPVSTSNLYLYGEIWASVLMEVWPQVGQQVSDKIVLQSLYNHSSSMLLSDAALVILDADSLLYGGAHHNPYQEAFCDRGLLNGTMVGQPCYVGLFDPAAPQSADWTLYPNPANGTATIAMRSQGWQGQLQYRVVDILGQEVLHGAMPGGKADLDLSQLAPAVYAVQVTGRDGWSQAQRLVVR